MHGMALAWAWLYTECIGCVGWTVALYLHNGLDQDLDVTTSSKFTIPTCICWFPARPLALGTTRLVSL